MISNSTLLSVAEAKNIIRHHVQPLPPKVMPISEAAGLVLAEDLFAPDNMPHFAQSAMDGFAFCFEDYLQTSRLSVTAEVPAGSAAFVQLQKGEAARIFTGAPLPEGADTVVMQEKTRMDNGVVCIEDDTLQRGSNIRPVGSEIRKGTLALTAGTYLSAGAIGFAASLGFDALKVYAPPAVSLLITGKELQQPGQPLASGQVYESNSFALTAALRKLGFNQVKVQWVDDSLEAVQAALTTALSQSNLVLLTGGVSVGDYDFVVAAAGKCGVRQLFHKVAQKPGKPLFYGMSQSTLVFGLPGNPSSVLTCFYQYVVPALEVILQRPGLVQQVQLPLSTAVQKKVGLTHFLKGVTSPEGVTPLGAQESFRLSSFATANCLIQLNPDVEFLDVGSIVTVHLIPL